MRHYMFAIIRQAIAFCLGWLIIYIVLLFTTNAFILTVVQTVFFYVYYYLFDFVYQRVVRNRSSERS